MSVCLSFHFPIEVCAQLLLDSFIPILLKFYRCLNHALKMRLDIIIELRLHFFRNLNFVIFFGHFDNESEWTVGTFCAQLWLMFLLVCLCAQLLQFRSDTFENLQMPLPCVV